jgi:uncharacterized repeat protein (TIGR03803 family)
MASQGKIARIDARKIIAACVVALLLLIATGAQAQTFHVLYNFTDGRDGANPNGLAMDRAGNFYGTTHGPGYCFGENGACGGVFKFARSGSGWILTPLYLFRGGSDGSWPNAGVTIAADGSLYGTTSSGGNGGSCNYGDTPGCGTVYHLQPPPNRCASFVCDWNDTVLYAFHGYSDLQTPYAEVTLDQAGNLYGTAIYGGAYSFGGGVYKLTPSQSGWAYDFLYNFTGTPDGSTPYDAVVFDQAGNMYGTTANGGVYNNGAIFKMSPSGSGWSESIVHSFGNSPDGSYPLAGLISDAAGNLYGTTAGGGLNGSGTVYELSPAHGGYTYSVLYDGFNSPYGSGFGPQCKLVMDRAGNLYGTQYGGGANQQGMIFKLTPGNGGWTFTDLHDFNFTDGSSPDGDLAMDAAGNLFGTTAGGGSTNGGVIWEITP